MRFFFLKNFIEFFSHPMKRDSSEQVFQRSVAYSKQLKSAMKTAQDDVQKQTAAAVAADTSQQADQKSSQKLPKQPDENLVRVLMREQSQLKQLWRDVIADQSSVTINAAELGRVPSPYSIALWRRYIHIFPAFCTFMCCIALL